MWGRWIFGLLVAITLVAGYPYAALLLNLMVGTNTVVFTEADGTTRSAIMGPHAPRPDWVPIPPRSTVVHAAQWLPSPQLEDAGSMDVLTHKGADEIKRFYLGELRTAGFEMRDAGFGPNLNPLTASYLGISNMLFGWHAEKRMWIGITTRTPDGIVLPSRTVQVVWQKRDAPLFP